MSSSEQPSPNQSGGSQRLSSAESAADVPLFEANCSRGFTGWLASQQLSLALTTYQLGKVFMLGVDAEGKLWAHNRTIGRCLGIAEYATQTERTLWIAAETQLLKLTNLLERGQSGPKGSDALFAPRMSYFTGDLDAHDVGIDAKGRPVFVNTLFNCLATPSETASFTELWRPPFISRLAAEDRCHLNGLAMREGKPAYVTATSTSDTFDGWRDQRVSGGVVIDVQTNEIICSGLSMPHSPRWHEGKLWLLNSGQGEVGYVDIENKQFVPVAFCPGYLRGLSFHEGYAICGLSLPRDNKTFRGPTA